MSDVLTGRGRYEKQYQGIKNKAIKSEELLKEQYQSPCSE